MCFEYNRIRCLDVDWELDRKNITLRDQLGIGEFGPIYDAELQLGLNVTSRAVVKVVKFKFVSLHFLHHMYICRFFDRVLHRTWYVSGKK